MTIPREVVGVVCLVLPWVFFVGLRYVLDED